MASGRHPDDEEEDAAALYLLRMQGGDAGTPAPPSPLRDARSGRLISGGPRTPATDIGAPGDERAHSPLRPAAPQTPPPMPLPRGAPQQFTAAPVAPGHVVAQPGGLPSWFLSDGLTALRNSQPREAGVYYQAMVNSQPERAEGWLGLGAAMLGLGDQRKASELLLKGQEIEKDFPLGALVAEAKPGDPQALYHFAGVMLGQGTKAASLAAMLILDECMASPLTPEPLYLKADLLRRKAREQLEIWEARANPAMMSMKRNALRQRIFGNAVRILSVLAVVIIGVLVYQYFSNRFKSEALVRLGTDEYIEAYRLATLGVTKRQSRAGTSDPLIILARAYEKFTVAAQLSPAEFDPQYMRYKSLEFMLGFGRRYRPISGAPKTVQDVQTQMDASGKVLNRMDPAKEKRKKKDADLQTLMQRG